MALLSMAVTNPKEMKRVLIEEIRVQNVLVLVHLMRVCRREASSGGKRKFRDFVLSHILQRLIKSILQNFPEIWLGILWRLAKRRFSKTECVALTG